MPLYDWIEFTWENAPATEGSYDVLLFNNSVVTAHWNGKMWEMQDLPWSEDFERYITDCVNCYDPEKVSLRNKAPQFTNRGVTATQEAMRIWCVEYDDEKIGTIYVPDKYQAYFRPVIKEGLKMTYPMLDSIATLVTRVSNDR